MATNMRIPHMFQGKSGGVEKNTSKDVLTRKIVYMGSEGKKAEAHAVFERAGNKTLWQKIRNTFLSHSQVASSKDAVDFLVERGVDPGKAKTSISHITKPNGTVNAQAFENILNGKSIHNQHSIALPSEQALYKATSNNIE
jgi:hypothetical protein